MQITKKENNNYEYSFNQVTRWKNASISWQQQAWISNVGCPFASEKGEKDCCLDCFDTSDEFGTSDPPCALSYPTYLVMLLASNEVLRRGERLVERWTQLINACNFEESLKNCKWEKEKKVHFFFQRMVWVTKKQNNYLLIINACGFHVYWIYYFFPSR